MAKPEQGLWNPVMTWEILFVRGSILVTLFLGLLETQTLSPTAIQSGEPGTSNFASGVAFESGNFTCESLTPGFGGRG